MSFEDASIKHLHGPKAFMEYSAYMDGVYSNINDYNPKRQRNILIVFDDIVADVRTNKKIEAIIKELFIRCRKLNISIAHHTVILFCSKRNQIKFYTLINNEDSQQKSYFKLLVIIQQILVIKIFRRFTKDVQVNHILF